MHGQPQILADRKDHTTFRRAIQFADDDAAHRQLLLELARLLDGVLPRGAIEYQPGFVWRTRRDARRHFPQFSQLGHQVGVGMQASGRIDEQQVIITGACRIACIEDHSRWVCARLLRDDRRAHPLAPKLQLLDRRRAKGIRCGQQDAPSLQIAKTMRQLADGRRFARAVHAHYEHDG